MWRRVAVTAASSFLAVVICDIISRAVSHLHPADRLRRLCPPTDGRAKVPPEGAKVPPEGAKASSSGAIRGAGVGADAEALEAAARSGSLASELSPFSDDAAVLPWH